MFEEFDSEAILESMLEEVDDNLDKREGSIIYDALAPTAMLQEETYAGLGMVLDEVFADTASYYFLIKRAAERNLYPKEETYMIGKMVITPSTVTLNAGERFSIDEYNYAVVEPIDVSEGTYKVQCETAGTTPNQILGSLLPIEYVDGLETAELIEVLIPGEDEEDVETFRQRYFNSFTDQAFGGNKADYKEKINDIEGAGVCKIIRAWNGGYNPARMIPNETVKEWFEGQSKSTLGEEVYDWLSTIYNAAVEKLLTVGGTVKIIFLDSDYHAPSSTLVDKVQTIIDPEQNAGEGDGEATIGHVVNVIGAQNKLINFDFTITYQTGVVFEDVKSNIEAAIDGYFSKLILDWANQENTVIRRNQIESLLLNIEGIKEINDTVINGVSSNLTLDEEFIPVRGDVNG